MRVNDVAKVLGISTDWLRRLERSGRIPPATRDINGHRRFTVEDVERIRQILYATPSLGRFLEDGHG